MNARDRCRATIEEFAPVPGLQDLDSVRLPSGPARYVEISESTELVVSEHRDLQDPTGALSRITNKALEKLEDLLNEDNSSGDADYIRAKDFELRCVQTALNTQHKVDDTALKAKQVDMLPKLLEIIAREEKQMPDL